MSLPNWFRTGNTVGLAVDLTSVLLQVACCERETENVVFSSPSWHTVFTGVSPSLRVGGALYPAISGDAGAKIRVNLGQSTMRLAAPSGEYVTVIAANKDNTVRLLKIMSNCFTYHNTCMIHSSPAILW